MMRDKCFLATSDGVLSRLAQSSIQGHKLYATADHRPKSPFSSRKGLRDFEVYRFIIFVFTYRHSFYGRRTLLGNINGSWEFLWCFRIHFLGLFLRGMDGSRTRAGKNWIRPALYYILSVSESAKVVCLCGHACHGPRPSHGFFDTVFG